MIYITVANARINIFKYNSTQQGILAICCSQFIGECYRRVLQEGVTTLPIPLGRVEIGQLILIKIIKILLADVRLEAKCTKMVFGWDSAHTPLGSLDRFP